MPRDSVGRATYGFQSVLSYIENEQDFDSNDFWSNVNLLDRYHGTNLLDIFPELDFLKQKHGIPKTQS
jgi:hypothetical protein